MSKKILLLVAFASSIVTYTYPQSEKEIVSNYRIALQKSADEGSIHSMELKGDFIIQKLKLPATIFYKSPNLSRLEMKFQDLTFLQVSNDSLKWDYNPMLDKHIIKPIKDEDRGWQNSNSSFDFVHYDLLNYKELNHRLKFVGKQKADSLQVYILELSVGKKQKATRIFINVENNLIYKVDDEKGFRYFANYIDSEGFVFPKYVFDKNPKQDVEIHFNEWRFNSSIADSLFTIPKKAFYVSGNGETVNNLLTKGDALYSSGHYDSAVIYYTKVIRSNDSHFRAYNSRGLSKIGRKEYYEAISDFNRAIEINANDPKVINNRGLAKYYLGDANGAIKDYTKALELDSTLVVALKNRGLIYLQAKSYNDAVQDFSKALKYKSDDGEAHFKYAVALAQLEKYEEALKSYALAEKNNFIEAQLYNYRGVSYYKLENYDSARGNFKKALRLEPDNLQYLENFGRALYELGDYAESLVQFEMYLKKKNDNSDMHNLVGLCKFQEENYKGAIKDFSKSIELNGNLATYYDNRALALEMIEDYDGAIRDYSESIRIYPNDASVFYKRGMIKIATSKKIEGCLDLATANEMKYDPAKEAIIANCH